MQFFISSIKIYWLLKLDFQANGDSRPKCVFAMSGVLRSVYPCFIWCSMLNICISYLWSICCRRRIDYLVLVYVAHPWLFMDSVCMAFAVNKRRNKVGSHLWFERSLAFIFLEPNQKVFRDKNCIPQI